MAGRSWGSKRRGGAAPAVPLASLPLVAASLLACPARSQTAPSLAEAMGVIRGRAKVELSHALDAATSVPPGFAGPRIAPAVDPKTLEAMTLARNGERATYYAFAGPTGTHVEAPAAVSADGRTLDAIKPDEMLLPLVVLDDTPLLAADPSHAFSPADLAAHEKAHGRVPAGAFVALRTGLAAQWGTPRFGQRPFPAWSLAVLRILVEERGVAAVGQESLEAGMEREAGSFVLDRGRWMLAGLDHLDRVPPTGAALIVSWPRVASGFAFPARAYAVLP